MMKALKIFFFLTLILSGVKATEAASISTNAKQKIVVTQISKTVANVSTYDKSDGKWIKRLSNISAVIGKNGLGKTKEGDGKTPRGVFALDTSFGWGKKPAEVDYPFRKVTSSDYWIDDVTSNDYNKWVRYSGNPMRKWKSFERLNHPLYKYAVVIRYNMDPIRSGKGSAIFLHMKKKETKYTAGCIAIDEKNLVKIIKWLDEKKHPIIEIK